MKKIILIISAILIAVSSLLAAITSYSLNNAIISFGVVAINVILLAILFSIKLKDAFKASLTTLFSIILILEYICSLFAPSELFNNWFVIVAIVVAAIQIIFLFIINITSKTIKQ